MLHSRLLSYVDEVARTGSIRKAASHLNVAASAISRQILALETQLGTPLFHRLPKKLILTAAGEVLIGHIRQTLKELTRAQAKIEGGANIVGAGADVALRIRLQISAETVGAASEEE